MELRPQGRTQLSGSNPPLCPLHTKLLRSLPLILRVAPLGITTFYPFVSGRPVSIPRLEMMMSEKFPSPNAIPPRTSSTGLSSSFLTPTKAVLRPVPEADWLAPSPQKRLHSHSMSYSSDSSLPTGPDAFITIGDGRMSAERSSWSREKEKILLGPFEYMYHHPGKNIRTQLIAAFNQWLRVPAESLEIITKVVGMLHTASLL